MGSPGTIIETERLRIRLARPADAPLYHRLWNHPRVMINVGFPQGLRMTLEEIRARLENPGQTPFDARLAVILKATGEAIGECKLGAPDGEGISETDVKLFPEHWGHEYGVEIKRALVDYLFTQTDCSAIQATPNVKNVASIKMQEAVGAVRVGEGTFEFPETMRKWTAPVHHYVYRVSRSDWARRR